MDSNEKQFENFVRDIRFDDTPDAEHRNKLEQKLLAALSRQTQQKHSPLKIWRTIMKSHISKLATAAAIILIAVLGITLLDKTVTPAYAIEQTIDAMQDATTVHMFCRDWDGEEVEIWMTLDTKSGLPDYFYLDYPRYDAIILSTPTISYQYLKEINLVQITNKQLLNFDLRLEKIIEDITTSTTEMEEGGKIEIHKEFDPNTGKELIVVLADSKNHTIKLIVDSETKLPIGIHILKSKMPGNFIKDFDEIYFYEEPPEGVFDFTIPEDALVVNQDEQNELEDDPNYGISTEGLSQQEAASLIAEEYCQAVIDFDMERIMKIYPRAGLREGEKIRALYGRIFENNKPVELIEVGELYWQRGCSIGPVAPCLVKFENGVVKEFKIIIKFRQIDGKGSCVIAGMYGLPREIE